MLGWDRYRFDKMLARTRYTKVVFLHLVGSVGHVVHSGASGARNGDTLLFMLRWDPDGFDKSVPGHVTVNLCFCIRWDIRFTYCFPVHLRLETLAYYFLCSVWTGTDLTKARRGMLH
jgi:hypothetical protein